MVDATRQLLDELMGKERNVPLDERTGKSLRFSDPEVCKYALAGLCPYGLFKNTKSDLGAPLSCVANTAACLCVCNMLVFCCAWWLLAALAAKDSHAPSGNLQVRIVVLLCLWAPGGPGGWKGWALHTAAD